MSLLNEERKLTNLFDGTEWNVYQSKLLNLGVGAPGTDLLQYCGDIFCKATEHRMVCIIINENLSQFINNSFAEN